MNRASSRVHGTYVAHEGSSPGNSSHDSSSAMSDRSCYPLIARPVPVFVATQREKLQSGGHDQNTNIISGGQHSGSRWTAYANVTREFDVFRDVGSIDEKALEGQGDLDSKWIGNLDRSNTGAGESKNGEGFRGHNLAMWYAIPDEKKSLLKEKLNHMLIYNPFLPLTLRALNLLLSVIALALACTVYVHSRTLSPAPLAQQPSTIMAIVVQTIAVVYIIYIAYDEFTGRPLGLRDARGKMRLIMLDMLFIILSSANLSLAFNTLYDVTWVCVIGYSDVMGGFIKFDAYDSSLCARQRGLASFLLVGLIMWVITFTVSVFRLVERVSN